ncbi:MAG: GTPase ObgE [Pirellulaceae bacterium]|nr:GTPase ObgE [Pirellulaceae bacterium]
MFVDRVQIDVQAGDGGSGCCSFRRERFVPRGGPDGGDGGDGGSVILEAQTGVNQLSSVAHRKLWKAKRGRHGEGSNRQGRSGEDLLVPVPPGTVVVDAKNGFVIKDLAKEGDRVTAAQGGRGGKGNTHFKSSTNRAPRMHTSGESGESRRLLLELKTIADVGLIGRPNAGKSTLLSRLSHARPEIADYPFTTKTPNLGRVKIDLDRSFIMADIPGLIDGAHQGVGLGHEFLRHVERTRVLVHLVEPTPMDGTDPMENYHAIRAELAAYDSQLANRAEVVALTKAELPEATEIHAQFKSELDVPVLLISAVTGQNLHQLIHTITAHLDELSESDDKEG